MIDDLHILVRPRHQHHCIAPGCGRRYFCTQACDPHAQDDSICPACFKAADEAEPLVTKRKYQRRPQEAP